jgi:hypothetical protein
MRAPLLRIASPGVARITRFGTGRIVRCVQNVHPRGRWGTQGTLTDTSTPISRRLGAERSLVQIQSPRLFPAISRLWRVGGRNLGELGQEGLRAESPRCNVCRGESELGLGELAKELRRVELAGAGMLENRGEPIGGLSENLVDLQDLLNPSHLLSRPVRRELARPARRSACGAPLLELRSGMCQPLRAPVCRFASATRPRSPAGRSSMVGLLSVMLVVRRAPAFWPGPVAPFV